LILLVLTNNDTITIHLRMTGELRFFPSAAVPLYDDPYLRARFSFTDGSRLDFSDVRKFGRITLTPPDEFQRVSDALGIEPLESEFTPEALEKIFAGRKRAVKPLLLDQTVIAGLGNIYVDEALFLSGVHPQSNSAAVPPVNVKRLHRAIVDVLQGAIDNRGTTLRNYRTGIGDEGENRPRLRVYGKRDGTPCVVCSTPLRRIVVGQRGTVYCPNCQPIFNVD